MSATTPNEPPIHLPPELLQRLRLRASEENCSLEELAADAVAAFLDDIELQKRLEQAEASIAAGKGREFDDVAKELRARARKIAGR